MVTDKYLTAKDPEQRVAHMPPIVAPGPVYKELVKRTTMLP